MSTAPVLFFAHICPDTAPFEAKLRELQMNDYEPVNIFDSMANLKRFIRLRDQHPAFDAAKANGYIGVPAMLLPDGRVLLDKDELEAVFKS